MIFNLNKITKITCFAVFLVGFTLLVYVSSKVDLQYGGGAMDTTFRALEGIDQSKLIGTQVLRQMGTGEHPILAIVNDDGQTISYLTTHETQFIQWTQFIGKSFLALLLLLSILMLLKKTRSYVHSIIAIAVVSLMHFGGVFSNFDIGSQVIATLHLQLFVIAITAVTYSLCYRMLIRFESANSTLLAYASQSGSALKLARHFIKSAGGVMDLRCISTITPQCLTNYQQVLFVASTYGNGEPPDKANSFLKRMENVQLSKVPEFAVLALGDSNYQKFCAFGHQLADLLRRKGASELIPTTEVDKLEVVTINDWWRSISQLLGLQAKEVSSQWFQGKVQANEWLNKGQNHRRAHRIKLENPHLDFVVGDLLEVLPARSKSKISSELTAIGIEETETVTFGGERYRLIDILPKLAWEGEKVESAQALVDRFIPLVPRVYSIASSPAQRDFELLVRQHTREDGTPGIASSYLCDSEVGDFIDINVRTHPAFHLPSYDCPLIMIAAGTGLAPFIGFLSERNRLGTMAEHWLFFGEQFEEKDAYFEHDIEKFIDDGTLNKFVTAWSRDSDGGYIGRKMKVYSDKIKQLTQDGAYIFVCGSKRGFGESIIEELQLIFGEDEYQTLVEKRFIRTDLY